MNDILEMATRMQKEAWSVIKKTNVIEHWSSIGATVNLVGSLKTGLLINNRDIDFHIYTEPFSLTDSFSAISRLAEHTGIKAINYTNLLESEDQCIEWHASYEDQKGHSWQIDMMHILNESRYAGYFENVAERISQVLTQETREAILRIKHAIPPDRKVMSIQIYQAVIEGGIRNTEDFWRWKAQHSNEEIIEWMP